MILPLQITHKTISFISTDSFYVTWGARHGSGIRAAPGQPLPPHGKPLGKLNSVDFKDVIKKVQCGQEFGLGFGYY